MSNFFARQAGAYANEMKRSLGALLGIAQGLLADGVRTDAKIELLDDWLTVNSAPLRFVFRTSIRGAYSESHLDPSWNTKLGSAYRTAFGWAKSVGSLLPTARLLRGHRFVGSGPSEARPVEIPYRVKI